MSSTEILNQIGVATPCQADWNEMTGDHQVRHCGLCRKNVYNISEIPADEALQLIRESEGDLCVRLYRRSDGTVLNGDCPVGVRRVWSKWKRLVAVAGTAAIVGLAVRLAPSLQAGVPQTGITTTQASTSPGPVMEAFQDLVATLKDWFGIEPDRNYSPIMGDMCAPPGWPGTGPFGVVEDPSLPPAPPAAIRHSDA